MRKSGCRYEFPSKSLLKQYGGFEPNSVNTADDPDAGIIIEVLKNNGTSAWIEEIKQGPTFRQYKLGFKRGTLRSSVLKKNEDFVQNLCVSSVRIIPPGQDNSFIIIEVPNRKRFTIGFDEMVDSVKASKANIPMALGMDVSVWARNTEPSRARDRDPAIAQRKQPHIRSSIVFL